MAHFFRPVHVQMAKQIGGLVVMAFKGERKFPSKDAGASRIAYALPFEGTWCTLNGGVVKEASHSWDVYTQRYAYDFVVLDDAGSSCRPGTDPADPHSYYCYGLDVLAPADGVVAEVGRGCPDAPVAADEASVSCGGNDIRGNYVLIEHATASASEFSCLCHFAPGSICVCVGDTVVRGQVLGQCGSSGNSSEPHIHFHVQAGRSFYTSFGIPVRFAGIEAKPAPSYAAADPRPLPDDAHATFPPFLTRGLCARNQEA